MCDYFHQQFVDLFVHFQSIISLTWNERVNLIKVEVKVDSLSYVVGTEI